MQILPRDKLPASSAIIGQVGHGTLCLIKISVPFGAEMASASVDFAVNSLLFGSFMWLFYYIFAIMR